MGSRDIGPIYTCLFKVIADHTSNPAFVAADLLSQAEHGVDSQVVLVAVNFTAEQLCDIEREVDEQARVLSRVDILRQSITRSIIVKASSVEKAIEFSNDYAPEHLILHLENASEKVTLVDNAGSIFVGPYSPERFVQYLTPNSFRISFNLLVVAIMPRVQITRFPPMVMLVNSVGSILRHSKNISHRKRSRQLVYNSLDQP
jgi:Histidinol dehydrogenase